MPEIGIDISKNCSKSIEEFREESFNYVITVCDSARETCPFFPRKKIIHKAFEYPPNLKVLKKKYERELDGLEKKSENG